MSNRFRSRLARTRWLRPFSALLVLILLMSTIGPQGRVQPPKVEANPYPPDWGGSAVHYSPAPWPSDSQWTAYTRGGAAIKDPRTSDPSNGGTRPQNYVNVSSGCTDQSEPSVYWYYNAISQTVFYRFKIEQIANTYATGPSTGTYGNADPWNAGTWSVLIDTTGDGYRDFALILDGQTGTPSEPIDRLVSVWSESKNQYVNYQTDSTIKVVAHNPAAFTDSSTSKILNFHGTLSPDTSWPNGAAETNWDYGTTRAVNISTSSCNEYIVDYQIPLGMLDASGVGGPTVTANTPMAFMFATANSNTNPLQKDAVFAGDYTSDPTKPAPFGDAITLSGGSLLAPIVESVSTSGCSPASLSATVQDVVTISSGAAQTTVTAADFWFYYDADSDGLADDGNSWTFATAGSTTNSPVGSWTGSWVTATQYVKGQYLIGVQATDGVSTTKSWLANPPDSDGNPSSNPGTVWATFNNNSCGVTPPNVSKTVTPSNVTTGGTVTYTISVANPTSSGITLSRITDTLPSGFSFGNTTSRSLAAATSPSFGMTDTVTWTFSDKSVAATTTATFVFTATASTTTGSYLNQVKSATGFGTLDSGLVAEVTVGSPYLSIAKSAAVTTVAPGGNVTYAITYGNDSIVRATSVVISDVLPTGVTFVSADSNGSYNSTIRTVTWSVGELAPGDSGLTKQVIVQTGNPYTGLVPLAATATILSDETSPSSATASVNVSQPTLSLSHGANKSVASAGASVVYTLTYANVSGSGVTGAVLTDVVPTGLAYVSSSGSGSQSNGIVTWSLGSLSAGASGNQWYTATVGNPYTGTYPAISTAYLRSNETSMISDSHSLGIISNIDVCVLDYFHVVTASVGFDGNKPIANTTAPTSGSASTLALVATTTEAEVARFYLNPALSQLTYFTGSITTTAWIDKSGGPQISVRAYLYDYNPTTGVTTSLGTASSNVGTGNRTDYRLDFSITPTATVAADHRLLWIFTGTSNSSTSDFSFKYDSTSLPSNSRVCTSPPPNLTLDKTVSFPTISPPESVTYTVQFGNSGGVSATLTVLTDALPSSVTFVTSTLNGNPVSPTVLSGNVLSFTVNSNDQAAGSGYVFGGQQGNLVVKGSVGTLSSSVTTLTNTANLQSNQTSMISSTATSAVAQPYLTLTKAADDTLLSPGDKVTYTLTLVNSGAGAASSIMVTDVLSETSYFTYVTDSASPAATYTSSSHTLSWTGLSLAAGASTVLTFTMQVASSGVPSGTTTRSNTATATSAQTSDTTTSNTVSVTISSNPNLAIGVRMSPSGTLSADQLVTYTVVVSNTGASDAVSTVITNAIPSYMSFVSGTLTLQGASKTNADDSDAGAYDAANRMVKWSLGTFSANTSGITATYQVRVDATMPSGTTPVTDTANIAAANAASKSASVSAQVSAQPSFSLTDDAPSVLGYPPTTLAVAASNTVTITVQSVSQLNVGDTVYINGTTTTISSIDSTTNQVVLATAVTASTGAAVYGTIEYVISYNNTGTSQATSMVITDVLQSGLVYVSSNPSGTVSGQTITWTLSSLNIDVPGQVRVVARPSASGTYTNVAQIDSAETAASSSNTVTTVVGAPVLDKRTTTPTVSQTITGASATYVVTVTNPLNTTVNGVIVTDTLVSGFGYSSTNGIGGTATRSSAFTPTVGSALPAWGTFSIPASGSVVISYTASISTSVGPATYQSDSDATSTSVSVLDFDPLITTADDVTVLVAALVITDTTSSPTVVNTDAGTVATYTLALRNTGTDTATGVRITDTLPSGFTYLSTVGYDGNSTRTSTVNPSAGSTTPSWGAWTVPSSTGVVSITFNVAVASSVLDATYSSTASATADNTTVPDFDGSAQTSENVTVTHPSLVVAKTDSPDPVTSGALLTYTLYVTNSGSASATGVVLTDTVPTSTTFASASGSGSHNSGTGDVSWSLGSLTAGASVTRTLVVTTASGIASGRTITNSNYRTDSNETAVYTGSTVTTTFVADPTAVRLASLGARSLPSGIEIGWETGSELYVVGFNLWRASEAAEDWQRLNATLVGARGDLAGSRYAFVDTTAVLGRRYRYRLEVVELSRVSDWYGPIVGWRAYTVYLPSIRK